MADGFELYTSFGLIDGSIDYIQIGSLTVRAQGVSMRVYGYMHVRVSWLVLEGPNEKKGVLSLNRGPAPKLASEQAIRRLYLQHCHYSVVLQIFSLKHGDFIISSAWSWCCLALSCLVLG